MRDTLPSGIAQLKASGVSLARRYNKGADGLELQRGIDLLPVGNGAKPGGVLVIEGRRIVGHGVIGG